jgi:DNA-directed RNA polymerase subunit M/transcription elongation factor TFIIS
MNLKCPKCNTIFKVKRKKESFKVECPTCGAEGTIKPAAEKKTLPEKTVPETPTRTLRCPKCKKTFTVEEKEKPFSVKCPHCGNEGTIR